MPALTHNELLEIIQRSGMTGAQIDLTTFLDSEQKETLARRLVASRKTDIEAKRAEVARFDELEEDLANVGRDDEVGL